MTTPDTNNLTAAAIGERLAWLGAARFEKRLIHVEVDEQRPIKRGKRKLTLAGVAKQAAKAGLVIVRVEFDPDGRISGVVTGKPGGDTTEDDATPEQRSRWH